MSNEPSNMMPLYVCALAPTRRRSWATLITLAFTAMIVLAGMKHTPVDECSRLVSALETIPPPGFAAYVVLREKDLAKAEKARETCASERQAGNDSPELLASYGKVLLLLGETDEGSEMLKMSASSGDCLGSFLWSLVRENLRPLDERLTDIYKDYKAAADRGCADAQVMVGIIHNPAPSWHKARFGFEPDIELSTIYLEKALIQGHPWAPYYFYWYFSFFTKDKASRMKYLKMAVDAELPAAFYDLAIDRFIGYVVQKDARAGLDLMRRASARGFIQATHELTTLKQFFRHAPEDEEEARIWFCAHPERGPELFFFKFNRSLTCD